MLRFTLLLVFLLPLTLLAQDKKPDAKTEAAALKGKWKLVSSKFNGKDLDVGKDGQKGLVFSEKDFITFDGQRSGRTITFTLNPTTDPKEINLALVGTDQKSQGLYTLDGDTLTLCYGEPGAARPAKMESKEGDKTFLLVLKRVKE